MISHNPERHSYSFFAYVSSFAPKSLKSVIFLAMPDERFKNAYGRKKGSKTRMEWVCVSIFSTILYYCSDFFKNVVHGPGLCVSVVVLVYEVCL